MQLGELEEQAKRDLAEEKESMAKEILKQRIEEIERTERILNKLKNQYEELLNKSVEDLFYD